MDKAMNMGKSSATGSFQLLIGVALSSIIMALGTWVLGYLLPRDQLGLYSAAIIPAGMITFFRDWGVNSALTKEIARLRAEGTEGDIHDVIVSGVVFEVISGAIFAAITFLLAEPLAIFLKMPDATPLIALTSVYLFAGAVSAAAGNIFLGFERMKLNSALTILTAIVKTAVGPVLVIIGYGAFGATIALTLSAVAGGIIAILIVFVALFQPLRKLKTGSCEIRKTVRPMLAYGVPLTISNTVIGVLPLLYTFLMASIGGTSLMGDYTAGIWFAVLLTFFTIPISNALFPTFAKINAKDEPELLKTVFASSTKYTSVIVVPAVIAIMALSSPMVNTLWPNKFPNAPLFLTLYVLTSLLTILGNVSLGALMTGLGQTRKLMMQNLLSLALASPIVAFLFLFQTSLSPMTGMFIGILGIVVSSLPGLVWGLIFVWHKYGAKVDFGSSAKILAASVASGLVAVLFLSVFNAAPVIQLAFGFVLFLAIYLSAAPLLGAVNAADIQNMRTMFSGLGIVSKIIELPLKIMEKPLKLRTKAPPNTTSAHTAY